MHTHLEFNRADRKPNATMAWTWIWIWSWPTRPDLIDQAGGNRQLLTNSQPQDGDRRLKHSNSCRGGKGGNLDSNGEEKRPHMSVISDDLIRFIMDNIDTLGQLR